MTTTILICEDDEDIANAISIYLENEGYQTIFAKNGQEAIDQLKENDVHLIIMDVMMPVMDGLRATMEIRKDKYIPIIMLSAKRELTDKILGLNMGADDYISKPFDPLELIARVKSQLRRYTSLMGMQEQTQTGTQVQSKNIISLGELVIDDIKKTVTVESRDVHLTPLEYKILFLLASNPGRVFSIDEIFERVWGEESLGGGSTVTVHIRRIREKIEINPKEPKYIKVVWGIGYKIEKY